MPRVVFWGRSTEEPEPGECFHIFPCLRLVEYFKVIGDVVVTPRGFALRI